MYIPLLSKLDSHSRRLERRRLGWVAISGDLLGRSDEDTYGSGYGYGGGHSTIIPEGHPFAGRSAGGGTRDQIFGSK